MSFTTGRWWTNLRDGRHVTLLINGQRFEARPTVIEKREAVIQTIKEFYGKQGLKKARMLPLGLPTDRQPTPDELKTIPTGIALVHFEILRNAVLITHLGRRDGTYANIL